MKLINLLGSCYKLALLDTPPVLSLDCKRTGGCRDFLCISAYEKRRRAKNLHSFSHSLSLLKACLVIFEFSFLFLLSVKVIPCTCAVREHSSLRKLERVLMI